MGYHLQSNNKLQNSYSRHVRPQNIRRKQRGSLPVQSVLLWIFVAFLFLVGLIFLWKLNFPNNGEPADDYSYYYHYNSHAKRPIQYQQEQEHSGQLSGISLYLMLGFSVIVVSLAFHWSSSGRGNGTNDDVHRVWPGGYYVLAALAPTLACALLGAALFGTIGFLVLGFTGAAFGFRNLGYLLSANEVVGGGAYVTK